MTRDALQHTTPAWEFPPGLEVGNDEPRYVWNGRMRVVSARRARVLRKRGVPLLPLHAVHDRSGGEHRPGHVEPTTPDSRARYAWFERKDDAETRAQRRAGRCHNTWCEANGGRVGRRYELAEALHSSREQHAAERYFRKGGKLAATTYYQTHSLYRGVIHENVLQGANPQLDLYAKCPMIVELWGEHSIETATGTALDALCNIGVRPVDMSDAELRTCATQGYAVRVEDATPEDRAARRSPKVTAFVPSVLQREDGPPQGQGGPANGYPCTEAEFALPLPSVLQREDETDREFVQRHLAAGNVPEPPTTITDDEVRRQLADGYYSQDP